MTDPIYLDYNATAPVRPAVAEAMVEALSLTGNPSSVHQWGRQAHRRLEDAREQVAALVGASPAMVVFTSGGTEANNLAIQGAGPSRILVSAVEHDSVLAVAENAETIPVDENGLVELDELKRLLEESDEPTLVCVMYANNETGVIQPVEEIVKIAHDHGALVHCDAVQASGKTEIYMRRVGVDLMSLSSHKLGGPQGVGALVVSDTVTISPMIRGGGQERGSRAGTENLPGIVGFGLAAEISMTASAEIANAQALRDDLESRLIEAAPDAVIYGNEVSRLPNTSCIAMPGIEAETQVMALDLAGVMVSAGSACSSGKVRASHVLTAMGADDDAAGSAIRVSFGWQSVAEDVDAFLSAWLDLYQRHRSSNNAQATAA
ncbi:MAG: cysteine desulfurase family protein [Proteobacteria bacterium]|nr:cysteine desulfurase family protein [Pseudomonadota bacterium]